MTARDVGGQIRLADGCCTWCGHVHDIDEPCTALGCRCRRLAWHKRHQKLTRHERPDLY